jgi:hypothetical protein
MLRRPKHSKIEIVAPEEEEEERGGLVDVCLSYNHSDDHWLVAAPRPIPPFICLPNTWHRTKWGYRHWSKSSQKRCVHFHISLPKLKIWRTVNTDLSVIFDVISQTADTYKYKNTTWRKPIGSQHVRINDTVKVLIGQSQWPRGESRRSAAARLLNV